MGLSHDLSVEAIARPTSCETPYQGGETPPYRSGLTRSNPESPSRSGRAHAAYPGARAGSRDVCRPFPRETMLR